jgi:hypothetical protein
MPKSKNIYYLFLFFLILLSFFISGEAKESGNVGQPFFLKYENGFLTVEAKDASLEKALRILGQKTGAKFIALTPLISDEFFTVSFSNLTFPEAVARLLKKFNYALMYEDDNTAKVFILDSKGIDQLKTGHVEHVAGGMSGEPKPIERTVLGPETKPRSLMNTQAIKPIEISSNAEECPESAFPGADGFGKSLLNHSSIEQIKKVIGMVQCSHLWDQTLSGLINIQDERITALLIDIARSGGTIGLRTKATEVLWRNTAKSEFKNVNAVDVLRMLATSSEEGVRIVAKQAVEDYQRYKSSTQSTEKTSRGDR